MTREENQRCMIQVLSDKLGDEKKEKKELQDLFSALTRSRLSEYDGLYKQIEEQQKVIDDQSELIKSQKRTIKRIFLRAYRPEAPVKTFDRALGDIFECPECRNIIESNVKFCGECGIKIKWEGEK